MTDQKALEAARLIVAADRDGWWSRFLNDEALIVARALLAIPSPAPKGEREKVLEMRERAAQVANGLAREYAGWAKSHPEEDPYSDESKAAVCANIAKAIRALSTPDTAGDDGERAQPGDDPVDVFDYGVGRGSVPIPPEVQARLNAAVDRAHHERAAQLVLSCTDIISEATAEKIASRIRAMPSTPSDNGEDR